MIITRLGDNSFLIKDKIKQPEATIILGNPGKSKQLQGAEVDLFLLGLEETYREVGLKVDFSHRTADGYTDEL